MLVQIIALLAPISVVAFQAADLAPWWAVALTGLGTALAVTGGVVAGSISAATSIAR